MKKILALIDAIKIWRLVAYVAGAMIVVAIAVLLFSATFSQRGLATSTGELLGTLSAWFVKILVVLVILKLAIKIVRRKPAEDQAKRP